MAERMKKPPASVHKGLLIAFLLPGMGEVYQGNPRKGMRIFFETVALCIFAILTSRIFFPDGPMIVHIIHSAILMGVVGLWLLGIIRTIQLYEAEIDLWRAKKGLPPLKERYDREKVLERIRSRGGKKNVEYTLDEMLNNPRRAIVNMSLVVSLTFIATKVNGFLDKVWIANISEDAVAAIATVSPIYSIVSAVGVGIGTGACVCIAYVLGKREYEKTQELATASIFLSIILAIPLGIFLVLSVGPIVGGEGEVIGDLAMQYVIPLALGCPAIILAGVLGSLFKSEGAMKKMTFCAMISIPVNMVLTPLFIHVFGWGIIGASIASVIGSVVSVIVALYLFKIGEYHFRIRFAIPTSASIKEIFSVGGPKAIEEIIGGVIILAQNVIIVAKTGSTTLALVELAFTFPYLMTMVPDSLTAGSQPVCSAHAGNKDVSGMWDSMKYALGINFIISIIAMIILFIFASPLSSVFVGGDQSRVTDELLTVTRMYSFIIPFYLLGRMSGNLLQVVRKSDISAIVFTGLALLRLGMISLLGNGMMEIVWVEIAANVITGVVFFVLLFYFAKKFDPDVVNEKSRKRSNVFTILKDRRASPE